MVVVYRRILLRQTIWRSAVLGEARQCQHSLQRRVNAIATLHRRKAVMTQEQASERI